MGIDPALVVVESSSKFSYSRSYILYLALFTVDGIYYVGSTKTRNPETETESRKRKRTRERKQKRNTGSNINDRKLKNFTLHNLVQSKENLF